MGIFRTLCGLASWIWNKLCHWYVLFVALFVAAVYCIAGPFFEQTEKQLYRTWAENIPDEKLQKELVQIDDEKKRAALQLTFRAYDKYYGANTWARQFAEDSQKEHRPRFADIVEVAIGINSTEDREKFVSEHMEVYSMCIKCGVATLAHKYSDSLSELKALGGGSWTVAKKYPLAAFVYGALKEHAELWEWYVQNAAWCTGYLQSLVPDGEEGGVVELVKAMRSNQEALKLAKAEIESKTDDELRELGAADEQEVSKETFLASAFAFIEEYGDVLRPLARAEAPMLISFNVIAQNLDAFELDTAAGRRKAGERLAVFWSEHETSPVWYQASLPSGMGVVKLYEKVPQYAGKVIGQFGDCHVASFLLDKNYYGGNDELLTAATHAIAEWEEPGWAVLARFKESEEFKELLRRKDIGFRVIPYVLVKGPNDAISQLFEDRRWADRYFNADGSLKKDKKSICEALPFIGGITTVAKNWAKGYPCTMEEIGWAAFDVVDIALTIASFGSSSAATTAVKEGGKQVAKQGVKQGAKVAGKSIIKKGGKIALRTGAKTTSEKLSLKLLRGIGSGLGKVGLKMMRGAVKPVKYAVKGWKALPPAVRKNIVRTAACVMFGIAVWNRTLKLLPDIIHDGTEEVVTTVGKALTAATSGIVDGLKSVIVDMMKGLATGPWRIVLQGIVSWLLGGLCIVLMVITFVRRKRNL